MSKDKKLPKATSKNKNMLVVILVLVVLLIIATGVILFMLLSNNSANNASNTGQGNPPGYETSDNTNQPDKDEYGKDNPIIMITDRNTPVLTSEKEGVFTQTAEVNMYCDLQDGYEISSTSGKAYKGNKPTESQMDYESSQNYRKYSQYGSVGLTCTGGGKYRKSDKWELQSALGNGVNITNNDSSDGRFTFTVDASLNADGSMKEVRDFAKKVLMVVSNGDTDLPPVLERYYMEMNFILNRGAQEFLDGWQKTIDAR